jgi:hypothetical protein
VTSDSVVTENWAGAGKVALGVRRFDSVGDGGHLVSVLELPTAATTAKHLSTSGARVEASVVEQSVPRAPAARRALYFIHPNSLPGLFSPPSIFKPQRNRSNLFLALTRGLKPLFQHKSS